MTTNNMYPEGFTPPAWPAGRKLRARIRRRARDLSLIDYQRYAVAIINELNAKTLDEAIIEFWEPAEFDKAMLRHQLFKVHDTLIAAIRTTQVLFP